MDIGDALGSNKLQKAFEKRLELKAEAYDKAREEAPSKEKLEANNRQVDELMQQGLAGAISDDEFTQRMDKLQFPPGSVTFDRIVVVSRMLREVGSVADNRLGELVSELNDQMNRANRFGLHGFYQICFWKEADKKTGEERVGMLPRVHVEFPKEMPIAVRVKVSLYVKSGEGDVEELNSLLKGA